jgi:SAM-dependent methyltransferase
LPTLEPSSWVRRWAHLVTAGGRVLDVACGSGRHTRWLAGRGFRVTCIDRDAAAIAPLAAIARTVVADIEGEPWPLRGENFDGLVVTNYLWPLWPALRASLADGGALIYETFALGNEVLGRPSNPDFLLRPGELLEACAGLHVVAFEDGTLSDPPRRVQRIVARRGDGAAAPLECPADSAS